MWVVGSGTSLTNVMLKGNATHFKPGLKIHYTKKRNIKIVKKEF